jgi:acetyl-CoA carboxylase carboxyltransferase component
MLSIYPITLEDVQDSFGLDQEHSGIIRHGANFLCLRRSYHSKSPSYRVMQGAYCVMNSKNLGGDFNLPGLPEIAVMGPEGPFPFVPERTARIGCPAKLKKELTTRYRKNSKSLCSR